MAFFARKRTPFVLVAVIMIAVGFAAMVEAADLFSTCLRGWNNCKEQCWVTLGPDAPKGHCYEICWFAYKRCLAGG